MPTLKIRYSSSVVEPHLLPTRAAEYKPDWFKGLPVKPDMETSNVRRCPGIVGGLTNGFLCYMPFDLVVEFIGGNYKMTTPPAWRDFVDLHHPDQIGDATDGKCAILKISSPYSASCDEEIEFLYTYPVTHNMAMANEITGPHGQLNFNYHNSLNNFLLINVPPEGVEKKYVLPRGMPIAQYVPLTERRVELKLEESEHWRAREGSNVLGVSTYYDLRRHVKRFLKK